MLVKKVHFLAPQIFVGNAQQTDLWCANYFTHKDLCGKIIFIAFILYLVVLCVSGGFGHNGFLKKWPQSYPPIEMLTSVLSNKAVLALDNGGLKMDIGLC